ncbi:Chromosome transmission fidelity protein 18 like protein [Tupaia chinensis]|uniref:Chromosome transmission fidelity protein 18 like protein n=1 Tax=Tupaia chinensis TaxID=246437 RepID=L9KYH8_TUPCH|nr:Chromosome transmission fidelity protein 18 like protein [Tupaia chinensis]
MEDYEQELRGVEDDFHSQFAAELEVLAELEAGTSALSPSVVLQPVRNRPQLTFEEAIAGGDAVPHSSSPGTPGHFSGGARKRQVDGASQGPTALPPTPRVKRSRLETVKRLDFGAEEPEEPLLPDFPPGDITPPLSPEVPSELWGDGPLETGGDMGLGQASARNPVLKRPPILEDYINVTSTGGDRAFLVLRADSGGTGVQGPVRGVCRQGCGRLDLLGVPFASLKEQVDSERRQQLLEEAGRLSDTPHSLRPEEEATQLVGAPEEEPAPGLRTSQHCLWVDEFAPRRYPELLSDDFTNRCLLKWLKLWDPVVFGREKPARKPRPGVEPARAVREVPASGRWKSHEEMLEGVLGAELDSSLRPRHKVALLCGPPGLGKTTLAHVIARHAGYCVVEMNASDDRSPEAFRMRIEAATQMESVLGAGGKPNCLVIDEIDGASAAAVNVLVCILNRKGPQGQELGAPPLGGGRRRRVEGAPLTRPIICICNDQFAPALRQLKQQAFLLHFPPTLPSRLVQRLQERELSVQAVRATRVGLKDQRKGLFSVWQEVFQLPRAQRQRAGQHPAQPAHLLGDHAPGSLTAASQRFFRVLQVAASAGEHDKVVQGLFDNFLRLRLRDSSLGTVCTGLDGLGLRHVPRIAFPSSQQEVGPPARRPRPEVGWEGKGDPARSAPTQAQSRTSQTWNLIQTLVLGIAPAIRSRVAPQALVLDTLCLLLDILTPRLRPVSTQLYSAREKQQLAGLVGTMLAYNLTYRQERTPDGQYVYALDPNVEEVCRFPELPAHKPLTYQAKQLIAHEVEVEKMRRADARAGAGAAALAGVGLCPQVDCGSARGSVEMRMPRPAPRNHEQRLENIIRRAPVTEQAEDAALEKDTAEWHMGTAVGRSQVWFRFHEGVSNAVRRSLYIRDLL